MKKWFAEVDYPLRSHPVFIEFTTMEGVKVSTPFTKCMRELVEGLEDSKVSPFTTRDFRRLFKEEG